MPIPGLKETEYDGPAKFFFHLENLNRILKNISQSKNPAIGLFNSGARNIIFYLEALCRIYRSIHDKKLFSNWRDEFKLIEDQLGAVDYYDGFGREFSENKKLPSGFKKYFSEKKMEEVIKLNHLLKEKQWTGKNSSLYERITESLNKATWQLREEERKSIISFFIAQIDKFKKQYKTGELNFSDIENGIHEFRRKLRWLSIYSNALNGLIQIRKVPEVHPDLKKYQTPGIVQLPYNRLPAPETGIDPIYIEAPVFYALSWMINELGNLKDYGLKIIEVNTAIRECGIKEKNAVTEIKKNIFSNSDQTLNSITRMAEILADDFICKDRILELLQRDFKRAQVSSY